MNRRLALLYLSVTCYQEVDLPDIPLPVWLLILIGSAAVSLACFRYSIPLILCPDPPRRVQLSDWLPLNGRWLRGGVGAALLLAGVSLALVASWLTLCTLWLLLQGFIAIR